MESRFIAILRIAATAGIRKPATRSHSQTDAEIIVMLHPDNQYDGALVPFMTGFIKAGVVDIVLGSRISRREEVLAGGMPPIKYVANRFLTILENIVLGLNLPEYHTGYRAYHRRVLETINFEACSDDFVFDQQFLVQARVHGLRIGAVPVPTHYGPESSSIPLGRSTKYAFGTLAALGRYVLYRAGWKIAGAVSSTACEPFIQRRWKACRAQPEGRSAPDSRRCALRDPRDSPSGDRRPAARPDDTRRVRVPARAHSTTGRTFA